ncbi:MAG: hypothetical protein H6873_06790 [Hyphomicrobiaceae bacterium]|nr:hypothetical protein [Hyphomicrobiaceae bacterium]
MQSESANLCGECPIRHLRCSVLDLPYSESELRSANVNPETGLATDYLNHFNEYLMLAELVADDLEDRAILGDWRPIDYCGHFLKSKLAGHETAVAVYQCLPADRRDRFKHAVAGLDEAILAHKRGDVPISLLDEISAKRDAVADLISAERGFDEHAATQDEIDALFG